MFIGLGVLLIGYAVFDGMDLGVGAMHLILARTDEERRSHFAAIGPFWMGYEVFLVAGGGAIVSAFPRLYAESFSGFYLVLTVVLWLLIARGISIEIRSRVEDPLWRGFWDFAFCISSILLAIFFGAAAGNVVRGVPMDSHGAFIGSFALALNPYAILVAVLSLVTLSMHGCCFIANKAPSDNLRFRARAWAQGLFWAFVSLLVGTTAASFAVRPGLTDNFMRYPFLLVFPLVIATAIVGLFLALRRDRMSHALPATAALIAGMLGCAGTGVFPALLPVLGHATGGLTIDNASAPELNLTISLATLVFGMIVVGIYELFIHRAFAGTADIGDVQH